MTAPDSAGDAEQEPTSVDAGTTGGHPPARGAGPVIDERTTRLVLQHGAAILRVAQRYSACPADAEDAYQRGIEILLTKAPNDDPAQLVPWLTTVVKHEALALRRKRRRIADELSDDLLERWGSQRAVPEEQLAERERLRVGAEALRRLKPAELTCLLLKAEGLSYLEICERTGFSYTKVNRCLAEGRQAFRSRVRAIESGAECERLAPLLSLLADGEASKQIAQEVEPHLANCAACRATLREFRSLPAEAALVVPPVLAESNDGAQRLLAQVWEWLVAMAHSVTSRTADAAYGIAQWAEVAPAKKAVAIAAMTATLAAGGATVERATHSRGRVVNQPIGTSHAGEQVASRPYPNGSAQPMAYRGATSGGAQSDRRGESAHADRNVGARSHIAANASELLGPDGVASTRSGASPPAGVNRVSADSRHALAEYPSTDAGSAPTQSPQSTEVPFGEEEVRP